MTSTRRQFLRKASAGAFLPSALSLPGIAPPPRAAKPLKILVLGGTRFVGRLYVEQALERGHEVTLFNRGRSNPNLFSGVETLIGDRDGQLDLYDRLGSKDKRLHAYPGVHVDNGPEAFEVQADFLKRYL